VIVFSIVGVGVEEDMSVFGSKVKDSVGVAEDLEIVGVDANTKVVVSPGVGITGGLVGCGAQAAKSRIKKIPR
jgi:hypothetical protein